MNRSKNKIISFACGVCALALIAGSWAYFTSTSTIDNNLHTKSYSDRTVEEFTPDQTIEPGSEITKKVDVENTGDYDLVVRIKMNEIWKRNSSTLKTIASSDATFNTVVKDGTKYTATQGDVADGLLTDDQSVMYKNLDLTNWTYGGDGYWYYNKKLAPNKSTGALLNSLTMATNADMGKYAESVTSYSIADKTAVATAQNAFDASPTEANKAALEAVYSWTTTKPADASKINFVKSDKALDPAKLGYSSADYTLSIVTEVCQATKNAVTASWTTGTVPAALIDLLG